MMTAWWTAFLLAAGLGGDSLNQGRMAYLREIEKEIAELDRKLERIYQDSLARYRPDSVFQREILAQARTARDHVDNLKDDLASVSGEIAPQPWEERQARLRMSLDRLTRLYFTADSSRRAEEGRSGADRRARGP